MIILTSKLEIPKVNKSDGEKIKTLMLDLDIKDNYIKVSFEKYRKTKYNDIFVFLKKYSVLVPYDSIQSIEII